jgi:hypothetical protein
MKALGYTSCKEDLMAYSLCTLILFGKHAAAPPPPLPHSHWPLLAVRDLTHDGRLSTHDVSVLKLSKVSFRGKCARIGHPLKLPSPKNFAGLGHFPPASQAGRLAGPFYTNLFSVSLHCINALQVLIIKKNQNISV